MEPIGGRRSYEEIVGAIGESLKRSGVLTDISPGSVTRTLVEAFALELVTAYAKLEHIYDVGFIKTAEGAYLDRLVRVFGTTRIDASVARGVMIVRRDPHVSGRIVIPAGTKVRIDNTSAEKQVVYEIVQDEELLDGREEASIGIQIEIKEGTDPEEVLLNDDDVNFARVTLVRHIAGVGSVGVEEPSVVRGYRETDEQLRDRVMGLVDAAGGGTAKALEQSLLETGHVQAVRFRDASAEGEPVLLPGELEIIVDLSEGSDLASPAALRKVEHAINTAKGPGVLARLRGLEKTRVELTVCLVAAPNLAAGQKAAVLDLAEDAIREAFGRLQVGETFVWNRLLATLLGIDGVIDVDPESEIVVGETVLSPPANVAPADKLKRLVIGTALEDLVVQLKEEKTVLVHFEVSSAALPPGAEVERRMSLEFTERLRTVNEQESGRQLTFDDVYGDLTDAHGKLDEEGSPTLASAEVSVHLFFTENQQTVEIRSGQTELVALGDTDFLRPRDPVFRWGQ